MIVKSDMRTISAYNDVAGAHIKYNTEYKTEQEPDKVYAIIEVSEQRAGVVNMSRDGQAYFNFEKNSGLTTVQLKEIVAAVIDDIDSIFNLFFRYLYFSLNVAQDVSLQSQAPQPLIST